MARATASGGGAMRSTKPADAMRSSVASVRSSRASWQAVREAVRGAPEPSPEGESALRAATALYLLSRPEIARDRDQLLIADLS